MFSRSFQSGTGAIAALLILLLPACAAWKKTPAVRESESLSMDPAVLAGQVNAAAFDFEYLSIKASGMMEGMGMKQNLSFNIRMQRHERVWISVQAMLGLEVGRVLITRDSVFVLQNLPSQNYWEYSIDSLSAILSIPLSVTQLQDLFIGNPLLPYEGARISMQNDSIVVEKQISEFFLREFFPSNRAKIARNHLISKVEEGEADVLYHEYSLRGTKELPLKVNIFVQRQQTTAKLDLHYNSISLEPITAFPFRKPGN